MGVFEIDDPSIDVAALEERVKAAIEAKRGVRFTDEELEELRGAELEPRMRREDLPRGWLDEVAEVRSTVPSRPPSAIAASVVEALYESGSGGLKGGVLRFARRLMRPFYRATLNLDTALWMIIEGLSENTAQLDRWRARDLHLFHNMVAEITALRLQQTHMQDRINELIRNLDALKQRERALESLTVKERSQRAGPEV